MNAPAPPPTTETALELRLPGRLVLWLLAFLPAFLCAYELREHAVDVPVWDDWERVTLLEKHYAGELGLGYLASAHIDHRPLLPRVLTLLLNGATGGDLRAEMGVGFAALVVCGLCLAALVARALPEPRWRLGAVFCLNLLLFSPVQYQNLLWGTQMAYLLPLAFLCIALWGMSHPRLTAAGRFVLGAVCATAATFCFGHGLIVWPVVVCLALLERRGRPATNLALAGALAAVAAAVVWTYFNVGYVNTSQPAHAFGVEPGERPPGVQNLGETLGTERGRERVETYFLTSLGNAYARLFQSDPAAAAPTLGVLVLVLFAGLAAWAFWRGRGGRDFNAVLPWLAAGGFAASNALLGALGRAAISLNRAILPRYASSTGFLGLALVGGGALVLHRWVKAAADPESRARRGGVALAAAVGFAALQVPSWDYGKHKMAAWRDARLEEQFALSYSRLREPEAESRIDKASNWGFVERGLRLLDERGLLAFPVLDEWGWGDMRPLGRELPAARASLWRVVCVGEDLLGVEGWAEFGGAGNRPADGIVFTYRAGGGGWRVFDVLETNPLEAPKAWIGDGHFGAPKPSYAKAKNLVGFGGALRVGALPRGALVEVKAWAVDMAKREALGIKGGVRFDPAALRPGEVLLDKGGADGGDEG